MTIRHLDGDAFSVDIRQHRLFVDQRTGTGAERGPTPVELFVASLAGCAAYYAHRYLLEQGWPDEKLTVECDWLMRAGTPHAVGSVRLRVTTPGPIPATLRHGLLSAIDACTVQNSIRPPLPAVSVELADGTADPISVQDILHHQANAV
ncbi:MAG: OsmC family protein [Hamadaea sp.]|uniref:OsmC family protein n=1 Tax=Hamadaea sp. TaxID=2024425 RepID=UPI0017B72A41|nr:OsmC family protein [Hamadaea sp.]NUT18885.1 OsmC family protein [Hamadaea sp.]